MKKSPMGNYGVPYMRVSDWNLSQREDFDGDEWQEFIYRTDLPAVTDPEPSTIVAPGMRVHVIYTFHNWNFVDGLTLHYVYVPATGMYTHLSPKDLSVLDARPT